jgi:hypothetical protein
MANTPDSDVYPTTTYVDPLCMPQFTQTNNWYSIREQCNGDWLLSAFINKLDTEIVDDIKEWADKKEQVQQIFDATRKYGWCVFQAYDEFDKVFTPSEWESWITEVNEITGKLEKVGINVRWTDELGNAYSDALYFAPEIESEETIEENPEEVADDTTSDSSEVKTKNIGKNPKLNKVSKLTLIGQAYLFVWKEGNGRPLQHCPQDSSWAIPDLDLSVLSLAIQIRQIQNTLTFSACNPYFYHLVYGDSITPSQRLSLIKQMGYAGVSMGVGAKEGVLKEIRPIENGATEKCITALETLISFYASTTRLPLSFYFGEKQIGSGLDSGGAEDVDEDKIINKKEYVLQHFATQLTEIASTLWGITLPDLYNFYQAQREEKQAKQDEEKKMELQAKGKGVPNNDSQ